MKLQKDLELCVLRIQTLSSMMRREGRKESEIDSPRLAKKYTMLHLHKIDILLAGLLVLDTNSNYI